MVDRFFDKKKKLRAKSSVDKELAQELHKTVL